MAFKISILPALALLTASATVDTCTPVEPEPTVWPEGHHEAIGLYLFTFDDAPYLMKSSLETQGVGPDGELTGIYRWRFWLDQASYDSGAPEDCIFTDSLVGKPHMPEGEHDYGTCIGCDPFVEISGEYREEAGEGCTEALWTYWYDTPGKGLPGGHFNTIFGYRHAETDGWPEELESLVPAMESADYEGILYDAQLADDAFYPFYASRSAPLDNKRDALGTLPTRVWNPARP